jgi:hypothetical protein
MIGKEISMAKPIRSWAIDPHDNVIVCYKSKSDRAEVARLIEARELTSVHDADLAQATKKINAVLDKLQRNNNDRNRGPALLDIGDGFFLAWVEQGVGPEDEEEDIEEALRLP